MGRFGAELDDLVQEGAEFVWQSLEKGIPPKEEHIQNRMRNWVRKMEYQSRHARPLSQLMEEREEAETANPEWENRYSNGLDYDPSEQ